MAAGNVVELLSGLYQIRMPIPIKSLGSVFAYLARDGNENLLIDTGWPSDESLEALESALESLGIPLSKIHNVVVSHLHPDHFGQSELIKERSRKARLIMHKKDATAILDSHEDYVHYINSLHGWLRTHGVPEEELEPMRQVSLDMLEFFRPPKPNCIVSGGEMIKVGHKWRFEILSTPGHTPGTICLYDMGKSHAFFSGDHILPRITPNVSLTPRDRGDPLGDYLLSLKRLARLSVTRVLPSHEWVFPDISKRIKEIEEHHEARLDDALNIIEKDSSEGTSAYDIATKMKWYAGSWKDLSHWNRRAAIMETLAHLKYLRIRGQVKEKSDATGRRGRILYSLAKTRTPKSRKRI